MCDIWQYPTNLYETGLQVIFLNKHLTFKYTCSRKLTTTFP